jgi:hypothetical protein
MARPVRLERTTCGFEVRRSIQLSYGRIGVSEGTRTLDHWGHNPVLYPTELHSPSNLSLARLEGFEPPAHGLEVRSSIHLSYRRIIINNTTSWSFRQGENRPADRARGLLRRRIERRTTRIILFLDTESSAGLSINLIILGLKGYLTLILISFSFASSDLGRVTFKIPFL